VLAIKPQEAAATLPGLARFVGPGTRSSPSWPGRRWRHPRRLGDRGAVVVRAMPNTRPRCAKGFTVAFPAPRRVARPARLGGLALASVGEVAWVEDEALLDPVTAVSGGGPAYVFLLAEVMEAAAVEQGLPPDLARRMARATVAGSGALLAASPEDAAALRRAVTSPKGTTERALQVLMAPDAWPKLMSRAIGAATARSRELAG
jgi:pyrroline-5-carboxylate reductase